MRILTDRQVNRIVYELKLYKDAKTYNYETKRRLIGENLILYLFDLFELNDSQNQCEKRLTQNHKGE